MIGAKLEALAGRLGKNRDSCLFGDPPAPKDLLTYDDYTDLLSLVSAALSASELPAPAPAIESVAPIVGYQTLSYPNQDDFIVLPDPLSDIDRRVRKDTIAAYEPQGVESSVRYVLETGIAYQTSLSLAEFEHLLFPYEPPKGSQ
jgi:hypothetical protein